MQLTIAPKNEAIAQTRPLRDREQQAVRSRSVRNEIKEGQTVEYIAKIVELPVGEVQRIVSELCRSNLESLQCLSRLYSLN